MIRPIPPQAIQAAAEALSLLSRDRRINSDETIARVVLADAAPVLAEAMARLVEVACPRPDAGRGHPCGYQEAAKVLRGAFAPERGEVPEERPELPQASEPRPTGVPGSPAAPQAPTDALRAALLRERLADALFHFIVATPDATEYDLADAVLAVRDEELAALEVRAQAAERKLLIAEEHLARETDAHGHDVIRAVQ